MAVKLDRWEGAEERSRDEAFAELYESSYPSLVKYCRSKLGDGADPEGVAQEAFLRAWMTWDRYSTNRPFWALVATIARNLCMDHHRHERVVTTVLEQRAGELTCTPGTTPEERLEQDEEYEWARQALAELCPNHQRLLNLREVEGWTADDIAEADGTTPEAATAALYRARQRLRDAYNRVAAGAMAGLAWFPLRGMRRRFDIFAHYTGQAAATSPGIASPAGGAVATVVALAVVAGGPAVTSMPQASVPDRPAPAAAAPSPAASAPSVAAAGAAPLSGAAGKAGAAPAPGARPAVIAAAQAASPIVDGVPDDATITNFTTAPNGSASHDIYATGMSTKDCSTGVCPVMYRSGDGGATWAHLKASGLSSGTVLLAPNYPVDKRIFVAGDNALQVSTDGGGTFTTAVPLGGQAAISPEFASDHRILLGAVPGWEYRDDTGATSPLQFNPRPPGRTFSIVFSPSYGKDDRIFVASSAPDTDGQRLDASTVTMCALAHCADPVTLPDGDGIPTVVPSRGFLTNGVVYAWTTDHVWRSGDAGHSFKPVALPAKAAVQQMAEGGDGSLYLSLMTLDAKGTPSGGLFVSNDGGQSWSQLGKDTPLAKGSVSISSIGKDRLLAGPGAGGGLLCSVDAGKTWTKRCPAIPSQ